VGTGVQCKLGIWAGDRIPGPFYISPGLFPLALGVLDGPALDTSREPPAPGWLNPVILATQEAEIRRTVVGRQPKQIVCENLS
jgi:hypothetical protein